jgi:hypothetical protein
MEAAKNRRAERDKSQNNGDMSSALSLCYLVQLSVTSILWVQ